MSFSSNKVRPNNVDIASSQTLQNKTLDGSTVIEAGADLQTPSIENPVRLDPRKDTLANLQVYAVTAQNGELVYATDAKKQFQVVDGSLTELGSGQGGINYLEGDNFSFDGGIGDWTGDTNIVLSHNTSTPLRGDGSLRITKAAVDASGQTIKAGSITVDPADLAKKITVSFDYDFTDTDYSDGDFRLKLVQDPNGTPVDIRPNGEDIRGGKGVHYAQFQTDATIQEYQLQLEVVTADATEVIADIDNVIVGPREIAFGTYQRSEVVDLSGSGDFTSGTILVSRVGNNVTVSALSTFSFTSSTTPLSAGGVIPSWAIPDERKVNTTDSGGSTIVTVQVRTDGIFGLAFRNYSGAALAQTSTGSGPSLSYTLQDESLVRTSEDLGSRNVVVHASGNGGGAYTTGNPLPFTNQIQDTTASWNTSTSTFTAPETGEYLVEGSINYTTSVSGLVNIVTTTEVLSIAHFDSRTNTQFSGSVRLEKGETLILTGPSGTVVNSATVHYIRINKLAQPQTILETETVAARYTSNSGQGIGTTFGDIIYEDLVDDTHNAYNTSTGEYTVPTSGFYNIAAAIESATFNFSINSVLEIQIQVNSTAITAEYIRAQTSVTSGFAVTSNINAVKLDKGDVVKIQARRTSSAGNLNVGATRNYFTIARIK